MKHAGPNTLKALEALIEKIRGLPGLVEKRPGIFYFQSKAILHFHDDPGGVFADARLHGDPFTRFRINTPQEQAELLEHLKQWSGP